MKKIILATACTDNYIPKIKPYLQSIDIESNFDENIVLTVDCQTEFSFNKIKNYFLANSLIQTKNSNNCLQHGEFLKSDIFNSYNDDDYICFTDGDIIMQRGLTDQERKKILSLNDDDVFVQYNANTKDNLFDESYRIKPLVDIDTNFSTLPCYNTGVVICNIRTWKKIEFLYSIIFPIVKNIFQHYAAQQWTISYIIDKTMNAHICDYSFHMHHHHGRIKGDSYKDNKIYFNNNLVLFAHHINGISA